MRSEANLNKRLFTRLLFLPIFSFPLPSRRSNDRKFLVSPSPSPSPSRFPFLRFLIPLPFCFRMFSFTNLICYFSYDVDYPMKKAVTLLQIRFRISCFCIKL
ncbi:hypothetical protein ACH5RR_016731 [Cinchona calisaya]